MVLFGGGWVFKVEAEGPLEIEMVRILEFPCNFLPENSDFGV